MINNTLYYVEHFPYATKIGMHNKGFYTEGEVSLMENTGEIIYVKRKVTATVNGKVVAVRRKSGHSKMRHGVYGVGVECVE